MFVEKMCTAVHSYCLNAGIEKKHLQSACCGRVSLHNGGDILFYSFKQDKIPPVNNLTKNAPVSCDNGGGKTTVPLLFITQTAFNGANRTGILISPCVLMGAFAVR
jgi:hypothetical protein